MLGTTLFVAVASGGYLANHAYNAFEWLKFTRDGVGKGLSCAEGTVSASNGDIEVVTSEKKGDVTFTVQPDVLMSRLKISRAVDEEKSYVTYIQSGKVTVPVTHYYIEEVLYSEYDRNRWVTDMSLKNLTLKPSDSTKLCMDDTEMRVYPGPVYSVLKTLGIKANRPAKHYIVSQRSLRSGDRVLAVGTRHGSNLALTHIGHSSQVYNSVRKNVFGVRYPRMILAGTICVGSLVLAYDVHKNPHNYK